MDKKQESPWKRLADFVVRIKAGFGTGQTLSNAVFQKWMPDDVFFSRGELGGLMLSGEGAAEYITCVNEVYKAVAGKRGQISRGSVKDAVQTTILKALDIHKTHAEPEFAKRLAKEIEFLKSLFRHDPETYVIGLEVHGLDSENLPAEFGAVKFRVVDDLNLSDASAESNLAEESDEQRKRRTQSSRLRASVMNSVKGKIYSEIEVRALDQKAAVALAENQLRLTLDVLNFFGNFFSEEGARVFLPGDASTARHVTILAKAEESPLRAFGFSHKGPVFKFSFPRANSPSDNVEVFRKASALLAKSDRTSLEQRVLAAIQWAGRAVSDDRRDKAFLNYCISLEALLRAEDRGEIAFTFALRGAHLIIEDASMRAELFRELKTFYALRSKIVHEGRTPISETDVKKIEILAKHAILTVLVKEPFSSMTSTEELEHWFEKQQLAGVTKA